MSRWDEFKKLGEAAKSRVDPSDIAGLAGDAVVGASSLLEGAESVAKRSGLTNRNGDISKIRVLRAATQPRKSARRLLDATAEEVRARRVESEGVQEQ